MAEGRDEDPRLATFTAFIERTTRRLAGEWRRLELGWSARTPALPSVWSLNHVCCTAPSSYGELVAAADAAQADLPYRHVIVRDQPTATAVEPAFADAGWRVERDLVMALGGDPPDVASTVVTELSEDAMTELMAAWLREEFEDIVDEDLAQVVEYNRREGRLFDERRLGVIGPGGAPLAVTKLRVDGRLGWVEDVYTVPSARGNGYAKALVTTAAKGARAAGCSLVVIVADADDWPQHLYRKVGFEPIGTGRIFHRVVEAAGEARTSRR